jgi:D-alanyl-D-alanine carboxypeptidase
MRRIGRITTAIGLLAFLLNITIEPSFARQTQEKRAQAKTRTTKTTVTKKKQTPTVVKATRTSAKKKAARAKTPHSQSERRIVKVQPKKRVISRAQRYRTSAKVAKRGRRAPVRVVKHSEPVIVKDFESVLLAEAGSGQILFAEEIDKQWPAASLTKMMVGLIALEDITQERFSLHTPVVVSERASHAGGRTIGLRARETFPLGELLQAMLVTSANDASVAVAERIRGSFEACVAAMNKRAQELGMTQTEFRTVNGMPLQDGSAGDFSSARDLVTLARALLRHELVLEWTSHNRAPFRDGLVMLPNTNRLVGKVDGVTGLKTGFTSRARYNLVATAQRGSLSLIAVVLGGRNSRIRFDTAARYLEWGFANYVGQAPSDRREGVHGQSFQPFRAVAIHTAIR